jgi:hypothetical protein
LTTPHYIQQERVDALLRRGVLFALFWLMGAGSLIAVVNAIRARSMIVRSHGELKGMGKVWWCFVVGGAGLLFWVYVLVMVLYHRFNS